ncbi:rRNA pseudouridine synthase [Lentibacillus cibarius]|uniref:Pseudouridine synthase n=1 Tax=Lentibacillus cibarius TaxID=2583219 RepID=A0A549YMC0_9BACI|nr:pseudouridine synthase [Lentibacillus cibarius]TRM12997.1 rRNA pseudouridine synthase [Lentibacillus cibarius]
MRLDKLLANMGHGSRKDVKALVKKKKVAVNGVITKDTGFQLDPEKDMVTVNGEMVQYRKYIYLMMNKPPGYVSATVDDRDKTVIDLLPNDYQIFSPFPVGRLDKDTEGLLLVTNDGELAHQLTSPKKNIEKTYYAKINGHITDVDREKFADGIVLDDGYKTKPAVLTILQAGVISEAEITVTEGKYHQVKRMVEATGKRVRFLKRLRMGNLRLDPDLKPGAFRELTSVEVDMLQK